MILIELKQKLLLNNIPERWYSIDEGLKLDACNLYRNYSLWEYFYLDERGQKKDFRVFREPEKAYDHLWEKLQYQLSIFNIYKK